MMTLLTSSEVCLEKNIGLNITSMTGIPTEVLRLTSKVTHANRLSHKYYILGARYMYSMTNLGPTDVHPTIPCAPNNTMKVLEKNGYPNVNTSHPPIDNTMIEAALKVMPGKELWVFQVTSQPASSHKPASL